MRPRFFEQNDTEQLRADLQAEIKKHQVTLSVDQAMERMQAQEDEYHRHRVMQQSYAQQQHYQQMQYQQQMMYGTYEQNF